MSIELDTPDQAGLAQAILALRTWQYDSGPLQLHPGDLGWYWRFGAAATAAAVRIWRRQGRVLAVGLLDEPALLRLAIAPEAAAEQELAGRLAADLAEPAHGVLPADAATVEVRGGDALRQRLLETGWQLDEPWTPLDRDLAEPVPAVALRVEVAGPDHVPARTAVQRAAFAKSSFTDDRWRELASGPAYAEARCLVGYDDQGTAVAAVTVWSAGPGRPGLLEPMGVHHDHRGRGHGTAITLAAAAALRALGASRATVCTESANRAAVATYAAAGFEERVSVRDLRRTG